MHFRVRGDIMADNHKDDRLKQSDQLYEQFGKPLEKEHWGEYLVVSVDGQYVYGPDELEVAERAVATFGRGGFMFKIGPKVMGYIR